MTKLSTNPLAANIARRAKLVDTYVMPKEAVIEYRFDLRNVWGDYVIIPVPDMFRGEGLEAQGEAAARFGLYQLLTAN